MSVSGRLAGDIGKSILASDSCESAAGSSAAPDQNRGAFIETSNTLSSDGTSWSNGVHLLSRVKSNEGELNVDLN